MSDQYAVFGNPIAHSKSPDIHAEFAKTTEQDIKYNRQLVDEDKFAEAAQAFFENGGKGLNITVPFKLDAYDFADSLTKRARQAGAVNTLIAKDDGTVVGDNTDGMGIIRDITINQEWLISRKTVIILGAGGAVRGILGPLLAENPSKVYIANRTIEKAQQLATAFSREGNIEGLGFDQLPWHAADLIINGTSASLSGDLPPLPEAIVGAQTYCYDMMYGKEPTVFLKWAKERGSYHLADGLGMLVEQAAESFYCWRDVLPGTQAVIDKLRESLNQD